MDLINLMCSAWPEGNFWATIIKLFDVGVYAWTIILFTIVLKLVLSPIDFLQRYYTNKTTRAQAKLQPELKKIKKRYGNNQTLLYQKQNELYQKNGVGMKGSCIIMIVYLVVTLGVFLSLFSSLQAIAGFKIQNQYEELQSTYTTTYHNEYLVDFLGIDITSNEYLEKTSEEKTELISTKENEKIEEYKIDNSATDEEAQEYLDGVKANIQSNAQDGVVSKYIEIKDGWIWIKNIWRPDKSTVKEILTFDDYKAATGDQNVSKGQYNLVMAKLLNGDQGTNQVNGYYILSIVVVLVSFMSQWVIRRISRPKGKDGKAMAMQQNGLTKIMMFILPAAMLLFTLSSSAIFSIYIITNSLMATIITPLTTVICNKIEDKKEQKHQEAIKVDYRR